MGAAILTIFWVLILLIIFYQDYKERKVLVILFILSILLGAFIFFLKSLTYVFISNTIFNIISVSVTYVLLFIYSKYKLKKHISNSIGTGDILFFVTLTLSFPTATFLILFSLSLVFSLILFLLLKPFLKEKTVPLAGFQALFLSIVITINELFYIINLYAL